MRVRPRWKDADRAEALPQGFRDDVMAVARKGEAPLKQIAKDFKNSEGSLHNWMKPPTGAARCGMSRQFPSGQLARETVFRSSM